MFYSYCRLEKKSHGVIVKSQCPSVVQDRPAEVWMSLRYSELVCVGKRKSGKEVPSFSLLQSVCTVAKFSQKRINTLNIKSLCCFSCRGVVGPISYGVNHRSRMRR